MNPKSSAGLSECSQSGARKSGRPIEEIEISTQVFAESDLPATAAEAAAFVEAGADHVIVALRTPFDPADLAPLAEALTRELGPCPY